MPCITPFTHVVCMQRHGGGVRDPYPTLNLFKFPDENNPYINSCYWHRMSALWLNTIKAAQ